MQIRSLQTSFTSRQAGGAVRWLLLPAIAACIAAVLVVSAGWWQRRHRADESTMTLSQALWVTKRDYSRHYPPGSPQSRSIAEKLGRQDASLLDERFDSLILYRLGLTETSPAGEPLLVFGFDPASIPPPATRR